MEPGTLLGPVESVLVSQFKGVDYIQWNASMWGGECPD